MIYVGAILLALSGICLALWVSRLYGKQIRCGGSVGNLAVQTADAAGSWTLDGKFSTAWFILFPIVGLGLSTMLLLNETSEGSLTSSQTALYSIADMLSKAPLGAMLVLSWNDTVPRWCRVGILPMLTCCAAIAVAGIAGLMWLGRVPDAELTVTLSRLVWISDCAVKASLGGLAMLWCSPPRSSVS